MQSSEDQRFEAEAQATELAMPAPLAEFHEQAQPQPESETAKRRRGFGLFARKLRILPLVAGLAAIGIGCVQGWEYYQARRAPPPDLLGSTLPAELPAAADSSIPDQGVVDTFAVPPDMAPASQDYAAEFGLNELPGTFSASGSQPPEVGLPAGVAAVEQPKPAATPVDAAPIVATMPMPATPAASAAPSATIGQVLGHMPPVAASSSEPSNAEVMARLARIEQLLQGLQQASAKLVPATVTASTGTGAVPRQPAQSTVRRKVVAKAKAPEPVASALGGQLLAVDMWAGEPSIVVTSGLPGDRRVRTLRQGDVVNGLAVQKIDPVAKSATFASPGKPNLTLFINQGG